MTTNEISGQEPSESTGDHRPTRDAGVETVHTAAGWRLSVREDGSVEATTPVLYDGVERWTTKEEWWAPKGETFRYGLSIERVLARYAHETRFDRDTDEHGAALRRGIIDALRSRTVDALCGRSSCDEHATHVIYTNAPTGPTTALVCDDHGHEGTYATLYALDTLTDDSEADR